MPIDVAFCRTAPSERFIALATSSTGVLAFECALSSRKSSLVHGLRAWIFFFGIAPLRLYVGCNLCRVAAFLQQEQNVLVNRSLVSPGDARRAPRLTQA